MATAETGADEHLEELVPVGEIERELLRVAKHSELRLPAVF